MKNIYRLLVILGFMSFVAFSAWAEEIPAPSITTLELLQKISEARGKVVALNFFASFCQPCRMEIPGLIRIREAISPEDFILIGIALDENMEELQDFLVHFGFNFPIYRGGSDVSYAYKLRAIPHTVIYDRQGRMAYNQAGYITEKSFLTLLSGLLEAD